VNVALVKWHSMSKRMEEVISLICFSIALVAGVLAWSNGELRSVCFPASVIASLVGAGWGIWTGLFSNRRRHPGAKLNLRRGG